MKGADMVEIKYIEVESLKLIHLEEGDFLFLKHPGRLSENAMENIRQAISTAIPLLKGKIIVLEEGMDVGVIRPK